MKIILGVLLAVIIFLQYRLWFASDGFIHTYRLHKTISEVREKNDALARYNKSLTNEIDSLKKGGAAIESRARNELGMVKKGEIFYQTVK